jgi:hypothetical protein
VAVTLLAAVAVVACGDGATALSFSSTGAMGSGFQSRTVSTFGGLSLPTSLFYLYDPSVSRTDGFATVAGVVPAAGPYAASPGRDSLILLVTTADPLSGGSRRPVVRSVAVTDPRRLLRVADASTYRSVRLVVEWAFMTSRVASQQFDDSAVVRFGSGTDSVQAVRVRASDVAAGRVTRRAGPCGSYALLFGHPVTEFASCSEWTTTTVDLGAFAGRSIGFSFTVFEAQPGGRLTVATPAPADQPVVLVVRRFDIEGAR